jgi:hypothetical protein
LEISMRNSLLSNLALALVMAVGLGVAGVSAYALAQTALIPLALLGLALALAVLLPSLVLSFGLRSFRGLGEDDGEGRDERYPTQSGVSARRPAPAP